MASNAPRTSPTSASVACVYLLAFLSSDSHPDPLDPSHTGFLFFPLISEIWQALSPLGALVLQFPLAGIQFYPVQSSLLVMSDSTIPWTAARQASLFITNSRSLLRLTRIKSVMPSNHLILCRPLLLPPSIFPRITVFSNESVLHIRWQKCWSFSFSICSSNEYSRLISFMMDWLDLLAVQGTLKSLFQHHSSKASILQCSAFFIV